MWEEASKMQGIVGVGRRIAVVYVGHLRGTEKLWNLLELIESDTWDIQSTLASGGLIIFWCIDLDFVAVNKCKLLLNGK